MTVLCYNDTKKICDKHIMSEFELFYTASALTSGTKDSGRSDESLGTSVNLSDSMPPQVRALLTRLNEAGEDLLSATDFALLQQCLSRPRNVSLSPESLAWSEERRKLIDTILAVKELLGQADRFAIEVYFFFILFFSIQFLIL